MLYWKANFSIPYSGVQAAEVFVTVKLEEEYVVAEFFSDPELTNMLFSRQYIADSNVTNYEDFLLGLEEYSPYTKI